MRDRKERTTDDRRPRTATHAKQSQLSLGVWKWARRNRVRAKQSQFLQGQAGPSPDSIVRNKANCHAHADPEIGVPRRQACETKPISPERG